MSYERTTHVTRAIKELQDERFQISAGAAADTKIDVPEIRMRDTIKRVLENAGGSFTDITDQATISDIRATGQVSVSSPAVGDSVTIEGVTYVARAQGTTVLTTSLTLEEDIGFALGSTDAETASNLADSITSAQGRRTFNGVQAEGNGTDCDLTANVEGEEGNSITLSDSGGGLSVSGATLTGGTDTGGIEISIDTSGDELHITWMDKPTGDDASG